MPRRLDSRLTRRELALLHIWPKDLGLDEQVREDIQRQVTGRESCRDMRYGDYLALQQHYKLLGAQSGGGRAPGASKSLRALYAALEQRGEVAGKATVAQLKKIVRMLDLPVGGEEEFLGRALKAYVGVINWRWLDPGRAHDMIEALKARQTRGRRRRA